MTEPIAESMPTDLSFKVDALRRAQKENPLIPEMSYLEFLRLYVIAKQSLISIGRDMPLLPESLYNYFEAAPGRGDTLTPQIAKDYLEKLCEVGLVWRTPMGSKHGYDMEKQTVQLLYANLSSLHP